MKVERVKLYDRAAEGGPVMREYEEKVFPPDNLPRTPLVPWREVEEVGQWMLLDDGGAARCLRIQKTEFGEWVTAACGEGKKEEGAISSSGRLGNSRFSYQKFVEIDGHTMPAKLVEFVQTMYRVRDPLLAYRIVHPMRRRRIKSEEQFPKILERERKRDRDRFRTLLRREDVQWLMAKTMKEEMADGGLIPQAAIRVLRELLMDPDTPAAQRVRIAQGILERFDVPSAKDEAGPVIGVEQTKGKVRDIRSRRSSIREKQKLMDEEKGDGTDG